MFNLFTKNEVEAILASSGLSLEEVVTKGQQFQSALVEAESEIIKHDQDVVSNALARISQSKAAVKRAKQNLKALAKLTS